MSGGLRKRTTPFVQVPSSTIQDSRLSFRARGILAYLLDKPDGWDVRSAAVAADGREGREAVRSALHELAEHGYYRIERRQLRTGKFAMGTAISESPIPEWAEQYAEFEGKPVLVIEQTDGTYKVRHADGSLTTDGFEDHVSAGQTEDGFSGAGLPGPGEPGFGEPGPGNPNDGFLGAPNRQGTEDRHTDSDDSHGSSSADESTDSDGASPTRTIGTDEPGQRPDVDRLCEHLADRVEANGSKRPAVTVKWRQAARLLLDRDGRTEDQVRKCIDWCQDHEFWRSNVMSMPTLRERYDQLRLQAQREGPGRQPNNVHRMPVDHPDRARLASVMDGRSSSG
jgi:hypothetical protein